LRGWSKSGGVYKAACEFVIICESAVDDPRPFPRCTETVWGAACAADRYGLVPDHRSALLGAPDGRTKVSFTKMRPVRLHARLVSEGIPAEVLEKCVSVTEHDNQVLLLQLELNDRETPVSK